MRKQMWFGTDEYQTWITCPRIDAGASAQPHIEQGQFLNGGFWARRSATAGRTYDYSWTSLDHEEMSVIRAFFDGTYGDGPFYAVDPSAARVNLLPEWLAAPRKMADDAPHFGGARPELVNTPPNGLGYPTRSAFWADIPAEPAAFRIAVPEGRTLHFGWHGSRTGSANVALTLVTASGAGSVLVPDPLDVTDSQRTNTTFAGPGFVDVSITGTGTLTVSGMIAQLDPPTPGGFLQGLGHSGLALTGPAEHVVQSARVGNGRNSYAVSLAEVGAWQSR